MARLKAHPLNSFKGFRHLRQLLRVALISMSI